MKTKIRNSISGLLLIPLVLACFALLPRAQAETQAEAVTPQLALPGFNTADGLNALDSNTSGTFNSAFGFNTLTVNTTGSHNTALGGQALLNNNGSFNTAVGENALVHNTTGRFNMAFGQGALASNTTGNNNVAMGFQALNANTVDGNVAIGTRALKSNTDGIDNTATGINALFSNTGGSDNTAYGGGALEFNIIGNFNTACGQQALQFNTGGGNIALGALAGNNLTTGNNNIDIGNAGVAGESNTTRIGSVQTRTFIAGIRGRTTGFANALPVLIDSAGQLGTVSSSRRFKNEIKPMDKASESILALKPVMFYYKSDSTDTPQFGLIAEEVAEVNPDLVVRDEDGEIYTVRYEAVNAMLLNEFLKEHRKNEEQEKRIDALTAQLQEQAAQIQKVSAQLEVNKSVPQMAVNNQ